MENENKKQNRVLLVGLLLIVLVILFTFFRSDFKKGASETAKEEVPNYPQISATDLKTRLIKDTNIQFLDIRSSDEYNLEHINNSVNAAPGEIPSGISSQKTVVILADSSGGDALSKTFNSLKNNKFNEILVLTRGISSWKEAGGSTISIGDPSSFVDQSKITYISPEDLKKIIDDKNSVKYILDVRQKQSFDAGRIPGAENIFLDDIEKSVDKIPLGENIFVYGDSDLGGFQAGVRLYDLNFFSVKVLKGGFTDWKNKGFEIVK
jgi:rhodanese-related sulfurtransferase